MNIKMVLTDVDGCMTNNHVIYTEKGEKLKIFNMQDGMGVNLLKKEGIVTGIISGDSSYEKKKRAEDLKIDLIYTGVKNKAEVLNNICDEHDIDFEQIAYMGDDIQDICVMEKVGISVAPNNAVQEVKEKAQYVTEKNGGDGAYREYVEYILKLLKEERG